MKKFRDLFEKYAVELAIGMLILIMLIFIIGYHNGYILLLGIALYMLYNKGMEIQRKAQTDQFNEAQNRESLYMEAANRLYELLKEYDFLGLQIPKASGLWCPNDYFRIRDNVLFFQYKVDLCDKFQTECETLRKMLNDRIVQDMYYHPLYIYQVRRSENHIRLTVLINNTAEATAYIQKSEVKRMSEESRKKSAPPDDEDF